MDQLINYVNRRLAAWAFVHFFFGILSIAFVWVFVLLACTYFFGLQEHVFMIAHIGTGLIVVWGIIKHYRRWSPRLNKYRDLTYDDKVVGIDYDNKSLGTEFISDQLLFGGSQHLCRGLDKLMRRLYFSDQEKREAGQIILHLQQKGTKPRFHPFEDFDRIVIQKLINAEILWYKKDDNGTDLIGLNRKYDRSVLI